MEAEREECDDRSRDRSDAFWRWRKSHKPRSAGGLQKLETARKQILP